MAITRRQFVTRLGALAAAAGMSQAQVAKLSESFAFGWGWDNSANGKPRVVWVHGAECTGCSTSVLGLFEDVRGEAIVGTGTTTLAALDLAIGGDGDGSDVLASARTFNSYDPDTVLTSPGALNVDGGATGTGAGEGVYAVNIQDVLIDVIDLQYHETVMNMGGDLAAQWLNDFVTSNNRYFVMVAEGAVADKAQGGAWGDTDGDATKVPWCSIGLSEDFDAFGQAHGGTGFENAFDDIVAGLATDAKMLACVSIGQCASFGGYPGCKAPLESGDAEFDTSLAQSGAKGIYDFLYDKGGIYRDAAAKVVNVPGCPTNPWWFTLTVVSLMVDVEAVATSGFSSNGPLGIVNADASLNPDALDSTRRLKHVYPTAIHGPYCPRFNDWSIGRFAEKPGDPGCLQKIGCKGPSVKSLCGMHGWNAQQPENDTDWEYSLASTNPAAGGNRGGHCTAAGHPCMGCTEKGYPDSFVPFVQW